MIEDFSVVVIERTIDVDVKYTFLCLYGKIMYNKKMASYLTEKMN